MKSLPWLRLYTEIIDDEKLGLLAFEDRWHFVALLCLKGKTLLDCEKDSAMLRRKVALKMGLTVQELENVSRRLSQVGLIDFATLQPCAWDARQMQSDSSAERVKAYRARTKQGSKQAERYSNVTVTTQDTDTDTDSDTDTDKHSPPPPAHQPAAVDVCVLFCKKMQEVGIGDVCASDKTLRRLIDAGASEAVFCDAASLAVRAGKGFAYALGIVKNKMSAPTVDVVRITTPAQANNCAELERLKADAALPRPSPDEVKKLVANLKSKIA